MKDLRDISELRRELLRLDPDDRVTAILDSPRARELVRSLPAQELYLTLRTAESDDAFALLPHASPVQLDFVTDVDAWIEERLDPERLARWIEVFRAADPSLVTRWLREGDEDTVVVALSRLLHVYKRDESTDQRLWPPDRPVPSYDEVYFLEPRDEVEDHESWWPALWEGLGALRQRERPVFEALLEQVLWIIPAEREDEALRGRCGRLAERGFPEIDEALEVWAPGPLSEALHALSARVAGAALITDPLRPVAGEDASRAPAQLAPFVVSTLRDAIARLPPPEQERVWHEMVRLAGRHAVAGGGELGEPATHVEAMRLAASFANLGLELAYGRIGAESTSLALSSAPLAEVARVGAAAVDGLVRRARALAVDGWIKRSDGAREKLEEELDAPLVGLLAARPRLTTGDEPRPFVHVAEIDEIDRTLGVLESLGEFLEGRLGLTEKGLPELNATLAGRIDEEDFEWSAVAATCLLRAALGETDPRPEPLSPGELLEGLRPLVEGSPLRPTDEGWALAERIGLGSAAPIVFSKLIEDAEPLEGAIASGDAQSVDPRFLRSFLIEEVA